MICVYTGIYTYTHVICCSCFPPILHSKKKKMKHNHVILIGYVGKEIQTRTLPNGTKRASLRVATHDGRVSKDGTKQFQSTWHDIIAWDKVADFAEGNFVKGSRILVDGIIEYRNFQDHSGHTRHITQIRANSFINLDR